MFSVTINVEVGAVCVSFHVVYFRGSSVPESSTSHSNKAHTGGLWL